MQTLPQDNDVLNTILSSKTPIDYVQQNVIGILSNIITKSSYIPYSGCVFEHILNASVLTNNEKLFYLVADSLSLINGKKDTQHRSVALSSIQWAKKLNCSKTEIFSLQKSLEEKGYFVIIRDTNKFGKNQRNIIIPTLPDQVFQQLYTAADRFSLDPKDKLRIPSATYFSTLTSISNSSDAPYIQANKRTYLDKTKLFFRINYQILSSVIASSKLSPFIKILWLYFYSRCYKNHIKSKQLSDDQHVNDYFAFTASYQELATQFACSRYTLSKSLNKLEALSFIVKNRFFVKNTNNNDNLHDRSLWNITVSLPQEYLLKIPNINPKSTQEFESNVAKSDPYCADSGQLLIKDFILNNDIKNLDSIDANSNFFVNSKNLQNSESLSELSVFYKNFIQKIKDPNSIPYKTDLNLKKNEIIENYDQTLQQNEITNTELVNDQNLEKNEIVDDKILTTTTELHIDKKEILAVNIKTTAASNNHISDNVEIKTKKITEFSPKAKLKDWYPLLKEDVDKLNSKSGREFSINFANELLLKLDNKYPDRLFPTKNHVISYMTIALRQELHQGPLVNHQTFRFVKNDPDSIAERQKEKYLTEVEYSTDTSYESQLRKKIAAVFEPKLAYQLLTTVNFITTIQEQRIYNNQFDGELDNQSVKTKSETIIQREDALLEEDTLNHQQIDIMQNSQNHSFTVKLNQDISLSGLQRQILENSITAVYGHVDITYQQLQNNHGKLDKLQPRQQYEIYLEELEPSSAWYKVRRQLKEQFGEPIDQAWFSKLIAEENLKTKTLTLFASSNFIRDWIKNKYGYVIKQFTQELSFQFVELVTKEQFLSHTA